MKDTRIKSGLADHFHLICGICQSSWSSTKLSSSKRTFNDKYFEVTLRSVSASTASDHGGLSKFYAQVKLSQPVTSKPYA